MQDKLGSATPSPNQEQQTSPAGSPQCSPLSCTSSPPTRLGLGPNLSPPFVLPPPPVEAGALSPNLFPLNAQCCSRSMPTFFRENHSPPALGSPPTDVVGPTMLRYAMPPSALRHLLPVCVFALLGNTREPDCVRHIFPSKLSICDSQISGIASRSVITGNHPRCFIKSILVTDVRHLPRINLFAAAPLSSSSPSTPTNWHFALCTAVYQRPSSSS